MHLLVCDDDNATRFAVKRMLTQHFPCTITECADGVAALQLIGREKFDFILLDIEMPTMSGIEVLELLRESQATKDLPVVVLSNVRDDQAVRHLLKLGVSEYILKPPRAEKLVPKIQRLVNSLPKHANGSHDRGLPRLSAQCPALLVDGNLDFRYVFVTEMQRFGPVQEADSGAAAVARIRDGAVNLVFVGRELGVVGAELLVRKLRESRGDGSLRIVGLVDEQTEASFKLLFDDVVPRSFEPLALRDSMRPFVVVPGPMAALAMVVPDLHELVIGAAGQVFGMMLDADVATVEPQEAIMAAATAKVELTLEDRFVIVLGVHMGAVAATAVAAKMSGADASGITDADRASVAGEVSNLLIGRLHASFGERSLKSTVSLPVLAAGGPVPPPVDGEGVLIGLSISGAGEFFVSLNVTNSGPADAPAEPAMQESASASGQEPAETPEPAAPAETPEPAAPAETPEPATPVAAT